MDPQTNIYLRYYTDQCGGRLDTFSGARSGQHGAGLGDILRGIFRTVLPIAAHGATAFLKQTLDGKANGTSWKDSARAAIAPAAQQMLGQALTKISQSGRGKRKHPSLGKGNKGGIKRIRIQVGSKRGARYKKRKARQTKQRIKFLNF